MKFNEFINSFAEKTKYFINKYEQYKELEGKGEEKKARVDEIILNWALKEIDIIPINIAFKWCLKTLIKKYLPDITQVIFNLIESKIEGITK